MTARERAADLRARLGDKPFPRRHPTFTRDDLAALFGTYGFTHGAEIGVCTGLYSETLCRAIPTLQRLYCVDPWMAFRGCRPVGWGQRQDVHDRNYQEARERLRPYAPAQIVRAPSLAAAETVPDGSLDFCYIDGDHWFDAVMADLIVWGRKVKSGGILAGDDYNVFRGHERGVQIAVDAYVAAHAIDGVFITANRSQSFFWVQP